MAALSDSVWYFWLVGLNQLFHFCHYITLKYTTFYIIDIQVRAVKRFPKQANVSSKVCTELA